jgi:hypothetical protein
MAQDNATIVRGFVDEVITNGNIEAAAEYCWEDIMEQVPLPGQWSRTERSTRHHSRHAYRFS